MVLRQRKRINNLNSFNSGADDNWNGYMSIAEQGAQNFLRTGSWDNSSWLKEEPYNAKLQTNPTELYGSGTYAAVDRGFSPFSKHIQNGDTGIPKQGINGQGAKASNSADLGNIIMQGADALQSTIAGFQNYKSQSELLEEAGQTTGTVNGISYQMQNYADAKGALHEQSKNAIGNTATQMVKGASFGATVGGPVGAAIGGVVGLIGGIGGSIFSRNKLKKELTRAELTRRRKNIFNMSSAMSEGMQQDYAQEYGDSSTGLLYANRGKDLGN